MTRLAREGRQVGIRERLWANKVFASLSQMIVADMILPEPAIDSVLSLKMIHSSASHCIRKRFPSLSGFVDAADEEIESAIGGVSDVDSAKRAAATAYEAIAWAGMGSDG